MKKVFAILFAALILISGMHLSIAKHICGGEVAAVKWSFSSEKADCGMEKSKTTSSQNEIASNCCKNEVAFYEVDNNYCPSSFLIKDLSKKLSQIFTAPVSFLTHSTKFSFTSYANVSPPDKRIANAVCLADICVFRI